MAANMSEGQWRWKELVHEKGFIQSKDMNYCPETVVVHTAFLLADKEAVRGLNELQKDKCGKAMQIVSEAIREMTQKSPLDEENKLLQAEATELEFKIHSWVFSSLFRRYGGFASGESTEEDYFDSFPPLPQIGVSFYLELVHEVGWTELLVECLYALGVENVTSLLDDVIKCLIQDPSFKDLSLFLCLFNSLFLKENQDPLTEQQERKLCDVPGTKSCSLLLLEGVASLKDDFIRLPAAQLDIFKKVVDFAITEVVALNFGKHCAKGNEVMLSRNWFLQNSFSCKGGLYPVESNGLVETLGVKSIDRDDPEAHEQQKGISDLVVSAECEACTDFLCHIINDWRVTLCWTQEEQLNSIGKIDCKSWHPLHKWIIKLYAMVCFFVLYSGDHKLQEQAMRLQNGLSEYVEKHATETEHTWVDGFKKGELLDTKESCFEEEFISQVGSVDLLLFQPETTEEQFQFYLQIVDGRLEDYKECFDWLLSAEEFHRESDWLECMRNHAVEISDVQHALKMIDIIYIQRQFLCAEDKSSDTVYREMKEILLTVQSQLPCSAQQQIIEYAFFMSCTIKCSENESIFFHPWFVAEERVALQQELVLTFNKLIDISNEDQIQSSATDLARAALLSAPLTLNKALEEGIKSVSHTKMISFVLQRCPVLCLLRYDKSDSSRTLLCQALMTLTVSVTSRQQENNLLNMIAAFLTSSPTQLLSIQEFTEAIVLPFLNNNSIQGDIPTVLALKLHTASMEAVMVSISVQLPFLKKHVLPIILCLCELLNDCNVFWDGIAPVHSLSEMEELRELVLTALEEEIKICFEVLKTNPLFARAIEWLLKRLKSAFEFKEFLRRFCHVLFLITFSTDWTIPLHLEQLFSTAYIKYKLSIPDCLLLMCEESENKWMTDKDLNYGVEDAFTVLFEYSRVSDSTLEWILENLVPNKLTSGFGNIWRRIVTSLAQILPHCTWREWKRILKLCRYLIQRSILQADFTETVPWLHRQESNQDVYQLSSLLFDTLEILHSPLCSAWATPHVWLYVIKQYITTIKETVDESTSEAVIVSVFAHVCHVMTFVPADCVDQLFVLTLDLVTRPTVSNSDISEQLKSSVNILSSEVHRVALSQKLNQNL